MTEVFEHTKINSEPACCFKLKMREVKGEQSAKIAEVSATTEVGPECKVYINICHSPK